MLINKDYAIELSFLKMVRNFSDGISFFEFEVNLDLFEDDHKPSFDIFLMIFNCMIFQFWIYNIHHRD